jgi:hypothetical protein
MLNENELDAIASMPSLERNFVRRAVASLANTLVVNLSSSNVLVAHKFLHSKNVHARLEE